MAWACKHHVRTRLGFRFAHQALIIAHESMNKAIAVVHGRARI
jgi:hypothetical protein